MYILPTVPGMDFLDFFLTNKIKIQFSNMSLWDVELFTRSHWDWQDS